MNPNDLIIELPHLQSLPQRLGSWLVACGCWLLWIYFFFPLVSVTGWLLGMRTFSAEVRWFGGYKSLIELLEMYGLTILAILIGWLMVTGLRNRWRPTGRPQSDANITQAEASEVFIRNTECLEVLRKQGALRIAFDATGVITEIAPIETSAEGS